MSYLDRTTDPRRREIAIAGAAAIQALLAYAIVTGLAVQFFPRAFVGPTRGIDNSAATAAPAHSDAAAQTDGNAEGPDSPADAFPDPTEPPPDGGAVPAGANAGAHPDLHPARSTDPLACVQGQGGDAQERSHNLGQRRRLSAAR